MTALIVTVLVLAAIGFVAQGVGAIRAQRDIEAADQWRCVPTDPGLPQMRDRGRP